MNNSITHKCICSYGRNKNEIFEKAWMDLLLGMQRKAPGSFFKEGMQITIDHYDALREEWKQMKEHNPQCTIIYYPHAFGINFEGVCPDEANGLQGSMDKKRRLIQN